MLSRSLGAYQLGEPLGSSYLGTTYKAQISRSRNLQVAIKTYEIDVAVATTRRADLIRAFQQRAQAVSALFHRYLVPLRDYGVAEPFLYTVSGLQADGSLAESHDRGRLAYPLSIDRIITWTRQLTDVLQELHRNDVVHGNLKPSNVFRSGADTLLLGDLPLVGLANDGIVPPIGTRLLLRYMSREQESGSPTRLSDQFALAAMIYEWLTGQTPFGDAAPAQRLGSIAPVALRNPTLRAYPDLDIVLAQALAPQEEQRYGSLTAFGQALAAALSGRIVAPGATLSPANTPLPTLKPGELLPPTIQRQPTPPPGPIPVAPTNDGAPGAPRPQADPSAFLLAGPSTNTPPGPPPSIVIRPPEEIYGPPTPMQSFHGVPLPRESDPGLRRYGTREQELVAPPAPRDDTRMRQEAASRGARPASPRRPPVSGREQSILDLLGVDPAAWRDLRDRFAFPMPRREVVRRSVTIAGGLAVLGGLGIVVRNQWPAITGLLSRGANALPAHLNLGAPVALGLLAGEVHTMTWTPDGKYSASGSPTDPLLKCWQIAHPLSAAVTLTSPDTIKGVLDLSWARDSQTLLASVDGANAQIWNIVQNRLIAHVPLATTLSRWHPRTDYLALVSLDDKNEDAAKGMGVILWNVATATKAGVLKGHSDTIQTIAWSAHNDQYLLASGGKDKRVILWRGATPEQIQPITGDALFHQAPVVSLDWSTQDDRLVSLSADGGIVVWSVGKDITATPFTTLKDQANAIAWCPTLPLFAVGTVTGKVAFWDSDQQRQVGEASAGNAVTSLAWSPDGRYLTAGTTGKQILVWDIRKALG